MSDIIYCSNNIIPWDTQSAFKITNYNVLIEEHMIFCYLKSFVCDSSLNLCSFCFNQNPTGKKDLQLSLNLNPLKSNSFLHIEYGIDGIDNAFIISESEKMPVDTNLIKTNVFTGDDEQGYYWAFELSISKEFIEEYFSTKLIETSLISFNLHQVYENSNDFSSIVKTLDTSYKEKMNKQKQVLIFYY